jgi:alpha-glucoside transport system substrate-binding protein
MSSATARAACCLLAFSLCAAGAGCASAPQSAVVTILVPWDQHTPEYDAFFNVVNPFAQEHGFQVNPESSRALTQELDADLAAGDPPDLVDLPSPAALDQYKGHGLKPLTAIDLGSYDQPWRSLAELGTGTVYAVPVKADVKSLIWYYKAALRSPPTSWAALENISSHGTPWCLGLSSGSTSGWPGADWVADILLSKYKAGTYENWLDGKLSWTSPTVESAWTTWGALMRYGAAINGDALGALKTGSGGAAGTNMTSRRCELEHGALSATGLTSAVGYGYVPFPSISGVASPILVSGDFMASFTDNPNAERLLTYLATPQAQKQWVQQPGGYAFSADQAVPLADYPPGVQRNIASLFQPAHGAMLCFSAEDMINTDMSTAFEQAILDYVNDPDPAYLQKLLGGMQQTQNGIHTSSLAKLKLTCAKL